MKCKRCGDEIQFQSDRQYWAGLRTGGECPAAPVTEHELTDNASVIDTGHVPDEPEAPGCRDQGHTWPPSPVRVGEETCERCTMRRITASDWTVTYQHPADLPMHPDAESVAVAAPAPAGEHTCNEENCTTQMRDWARVALQSMTGTMIVEVPLCDLHLGTIEISNAGQYMYLKARR